MDKLELSEEQMDQLLQNHDIEKVKTFIEVLNTITPDAPEAEQEPFEPFRRKLEAEGLVPRKERTNAFSALKERLIKDGVYFNNDNF
ncbi:MAG: hypothetical protein AB2L20_30075 [Mangrovibacterium sp.]